VTALGPRLPVADDLRDIGEPLQTLACAILRNVGAIHCDKAALALAA
jgi:hypothetical protein